MAAGYDGFEFWAYDVSLSILVAEMVGVAEATNPQSAWLEVLPELRVHAVVGANFFLPLDTLTCAEEAAPPGPSGRTTLTADRQR